MSELVPTHQGLGPSQYASFCPLDNKLLSFSPMAFLN